MSRRFKGRHAKVRANPNAKPPRPVTLDESNSFVDPTQPDCRKPKVLNARAFRAADVLAEIAAAEALAKAKASEAP